VVIKFDLSSVIPENVSITKAVLSLFFTTGTIGNKYSTAYRLTKEWDVSAVTWMDAAENTPWNTPGGDYTPVNASKIDYAPDSTWEEYDVTDILRQFIHGTPNYGLIIMSDPANGNKDRPYYSSDYTGADSLRPKLTITYSTTAITSPKHKDLLTGVLLQKNGPAARLFVPFEKQYRISLFNARGTSVGAVSGNTSGWYRLQTASLPGGIYIIRVITDNTTAVGKVICTE